MNTFKQRAIAPGCEDAVPYQVCEIDLAFGTVVIAQPQPIIWTSNNFYGMRSRIHRPSIQGKEEG